MMLTIVALCMILVVNVDDDFDVDTDIMVDDLVTLSQPVISLTYIMAAMYEGMLTMIYVTVRMLVQMQMEDHSGLQWAHTQAPNRAEWGTSSPTITREVMALGPALNTNGQPRASRGSATDPQSVYARVRTKLTDLLLCIYINYQSMIILALSTSIYRRLATGLATVSSIFYIFFMTHGPCGLTVCECSSGGRKSVAA
jgi:hypothetical protein